MMAHNYMSRVTVGTTRAGTLAFNVGATKEPSLAHLRSNTTETHTSFKTSFYY